MKKKSVYLVIIFALLLCLIGCNSQSEQNNIEPDNSNEVISNLTDNNVSEDENIDVTPDSEPVEPVVNICEKDKLADLYVKDLYDSIIVPSDECNWFHSDTFVESSSFEMNEIKLLAYWVGWKDYLYSANSYSYFDYDNLESTVKRIFGSDTEIDTNEWFAGGLSFVYEENMLRFCGDAAYGGDYPIGLIFDYFGKYEIDGDYLYIYDRVLYCTHDRWGTGIIKFYSNINKTEDSFVNEMYVGDYLPSDFSNDEALSEFGAEYKHTFKLSADQTYYYWVSSEPVK